MKTVINHVPNGPQPAGPYSLAVVASGKLAFVAGQGPYSPATGKFENGIGVTLKLRFC